MGGEYAIKNRDTNTDYQKFVSLGDQKWEIVEIAIGIFFFFGLRFVFAIFYREFLSPNWEKSTPPKVPIPTQNLDLTDVPIPTQNLNLT